MQIKRSATPTTEAQFRELYAGLPAQLQENLAAAALKRARNEITLEAATDAGFDAFIDAHSQAAYAGRGLAGALDELGELDRAVGHLVAEEQAQYLEGFFQAIDEGKYTLNDGTLDTDAIEARSGLYEHRLRGTANESFINALPVDELIYWFLGGTEHSCSVCPDLEAQSPYKPHEMPTYPGANETPCMFNCDCGVRTESGKEGF